MWLRVNRLQLPLLSSSTYGFFNNSISQNSKNVNTKNNTGKGVDIKYSISDDVIKKFEIENINDYVHVQKQVLSTLNAENFFDDEGGKSKTVINKDSGMVIVINKKGIKETFNNKNYFNYSRNLKLAKLASIRKIPELIENGKLILDDEKNYHRNNSSIKYAYIVCETKINGKNANIKITVRKSPQNNKFWVHHIYIEKGTERTSAGTSKSSKTAFIPFGATNSISQSENNVNTKNDESSNDIKYSMGGLKAETADKSALEKAMELEKDGTDSEKIRKETGWFKGYDGKWRFEIDNSELEFKTDIEKNRAAAIELAKMKAKSAEIEWKIVNDTATEAEENEYYSLDEKMVQLRKWQKLSDVINHPKLFKAYPQLKDVNVYYEISSLNRGLYSSKGNVIRLNPMCPIGEQKEIIIHEIQHAIQRIEDFANGSSLEYWENLGYSDEEAMAMYYNTAGEREARDVSARRDYNAEQRKNIRPDIDRKDVVFANSGDAGYSADENIMQDDFENKVVYPNMDERQRAQILRNERIKLSSYDSKNALSPDDIASLKNSVKRNAFKILRELGTKFNVYKNYTNENIELDFDYSKSGLKESIDKQGNITTNYTDFAKMLTVFDDVIRNAVPIEVHTDKYVGTKRENPDLKYDYVLLSAFTDDNYIVPVELHIKEYKESYRINNKLYVSITLGKIKIEDNIITGSLLKNNNKVANSVPLSSEVSIPQLVSEVNEKLGNFYKYLPDELLSETQLKYKKIAAEKDRQRLSTMRNKTIQTENKLDIKYAIDDTKQEEVDFRKALTREEWASFYSSLNKYNQRDNLKISKNGILIPDEHNTQDYKLVYYNGNYQSPKVLAVYKLKNFDYTIHDNQMDFEELLNELRRSDENDKYAKAILANNTKVFGTVFERYGGHGWVTIDNTRESVSDRRNIKETADGAGTYENSEREVSGGLSEDKISDIRYAIDDTLNDWLDDLPEGIDYEKVVEKNPVVAVAKIYNSASKTAESGLRQSQNVRLEEKDYLRIADKIMDKYGIKGKYNPNYKQELAEQLTGFIEHIGEKGSNFTDVFEELVNDCKGGILLSGEYDTELMKGEREFVLDMLQGKVLLIKPRDVQQIEEDYGSVANYRVALELNPTNRGGKNLNVIKVASAYGKDVDLQGFINKSKILYVEPNKERTHNWLTVNRLKLPLPSTRYGFFNNSISQSENNVNTKNNTGKGVESGDVKYSIKENVKNKVSGEIYDKVVVLDTNIFKGIPPRNWGKTFRNFISKHLIGKKFLTFDENGKEEIIEFAKPNERVTKNGANNSHKVIDKLSRKSDRNSKLVIVHSDEVINISEKQNENAEHSHQWLDENGWEFRNAFVMDKYGKIYSVTLNIAKSKDGRNILYDINKINEVGYGDVLSNAKGKRSSHINPNFVTNSISQSENNVNTKNDESSNDIKYSMGGLKAETADKSALEKAMELEKDGTDSEKIRKETGWFKGYDGKWRFEIDNSELEFKTDIEKNRAAAIELAKMKVKSAELEEKIVNDTATKAEENEYYNLDEKMIEYRKGVKLSDVINHPKLFEAYPQLKNVDVYYEISSVNRGVYSSNGNVIMLNPMHTIDEQKEAIIHEIQHAIQGIENFANGSNWEYWKNLGYSDEEAMAMYYNTAGEREARDVSARRNYNAEQRKNIRPDIDRKDVVFANSGDAGYSADENIMQNDFEEKVDQIENNTYNSNDVVIMGRTPKVLQDIGFNSLPVAMTKNHIYSVAVSEARAKNEGRYKKNTNYHDLGFNTVKQIYNKISDPLMVIAHPDFTNKESRDSTHKVIALVDLSVNNKQVIAPIVVDFESRYNKKIIDVNLVATYFNKNNIHDLIKEAIALENNNQVGFYYLDKKRTQSIIKQKGYQLPSVLNNLSSNIIIRKIDSNVNKKINKITQSKQFVRWFGDWQNSPKSASKVVDGNGEPLVVYHQTGNDFNVFDANKKGAGEFDSEMPTGIFMKPTSDNIGVSGNKQMALYANIRNPLTVNNRAELVRFYEQNIDGYKEARDYISSIDSEYKQKYEQAEAEEDAEYSKLWTAREQGKITEDEYQKAIESNALDELEEEWHNKVNEASKEAKSLIDDYFKTSKYDGVIVNNDVGSFGRSTKTYIAFENTQVKSATDNIGTFDGENPDIRYAIDDTLNDWLDDLPEGIDYEKVVEKNPVVAVAKIYNSASKTAESGLRQSQNVRLEEKDYLRIADKIMDKYGIKGKYNPNYKQELAEQLTGFIEHIGKKGSNFTDVFEEL